MGWTHCYDGRRKADGKIDRRYECDRMLNWTSKNTDGSVCAVHRVLKSAMVGSVYYAAVTTEKPNRPVEVWAAIFLTCGQTKHDGTAWGYKDMDETKGPWEAKCPASILALLTPTDDANANDWRRRCRENIAKAAEIRRNGPEKPFLPQGVELILSGRSWVLTSAAFREKCCYRYRGTRYSKARWHNFDSAMRAFLAEYGTKAQRAEYAASGRDCPSDWKEVA